MVRGLRWSVGVILGCVACGPSVAVDGGDSGTGGGTTTTNADTSTTLSTTTSADVTTSPPQSTSTTDATTGDATTTPAEESSSTGDSPCGCPEDMPIALEDELPGGGTPADELAQFASLELPLGWSAYDDAMTTLHVEVSYRGGEITVGPGGFNGCAFLNAPCNDGIEMDVVLTATTDDGWVSFETPARLHGAGEESEAWLEGADVLIEDNAGTLAMQPLQIGANDLRVDSLQLIIERPEAREPGLLGRLQARVSSPRCDDDCENDDDCGPEQSCIGSICFGGPCGNYEVLGEF